MTLRSTTAALASAEKRGQPQILAPRYWILEIADRSALHKCTHVPERLKMRRCLHQSVKHSRHYQATMLHHYAMDFLIYIYIHVYTHYHLWIPDNSTHIQTLRISLDRLNLLRWIGGASVDCLSHLLIPSREQAIPRSIAEKDCHLHMRRGYILVGLYTSLYKWHWKTNDANIQHGIA